MEERKIDDVRDSRVQALFKGYYEMHNGQPDQRVRTQVYPGSGEIKTVSCFTGGTFVPGQLKLRDATFKTESYEFGEVKCWLEPFPSDTSTRRFEGIPGAVSKPDLSFAPKLYKQAADAAWLSAYAKLSRGTYDFGATFAELSETIRTIKSLVLALPNPLRFWAIIRAATDEWYRIFNQHKLKKKRSTKKRSMSDAWLEYRYGIRPLMWEANQLLAALTEKYEPLFNNQKLYAVRASATRSGQDGQKLGPFSGVDGYRWEANLQRAEQHHATCSVYYKYDTKLLTKAFALLRKYGLSPDQAPALLWEVTPLSFVVDWFIDVKTWIEALFPPKGITVLGDSTSVKSTVTVSRRSIRWWYTANEGVLPQNRRPYRGNGPHDKGSMILLTRRVNRGRPGLWALVKDPNWSLKLGQQLDILSLVIQRFNKRR